MDTNRMDFFRNEIFISNTFIILLPSLNIYFTNVWESNGQGSYSSYCFQRAKVEVDIDFRDGQQIWPSLNDPLVLSSHPLRSETKPNCMMDKFLVLSFSYDMSILLFGYFITRTRCWMLERVTHPHIRSTDPLSIWYIFYGFHSRSLSLHRLENITHTFFMAFSSFAFLVSAHCFNKLYFLDGNGIIGLYMLMLLQAVAVHEAHTRSPLSPSAVTTEQAKGKVFI